MKSDDIIVFMRGRCWYSNYTNLTELIHGCGLQGKNTLTSQMNMIHQQSTSVPNASSWSYLIIGLANLTASSIDLTDPISYGRSQRIYKWPPLAGADQCRNDFWVVTITHEAILCRSYSNIFVMILKYEMTSDFSFMFTSLPNLP